MVTTRRGVRAGTAALAAAGMVALGACSGGPAVGGDEEIALTFAFWGDASRADRYEESIALFEEEHPNVTVQPSYAGFGDYWTARNTEAAGSSLPDVFQMDVTYLYQYASTHQLLPLDEYTRDTIDISSFPESVMPATRVDGQIYGIPTSTGTLANFFNADLLADLGMEPPEGDLTWDEYDAYLTEVAGAGADHDPVVDGSTQYVQIMSVFEIWLAQRGKTLYTPEGELGFTEGDLAEWWGRGTRMLESGGFVDPKRTEQLESDTLSARYTASEISFYNFLVRFTEGTGGDEFTMTLPPADDPDDRGLYLKPSLMLSIGANSEHPEVAAEFIDFITNDPQVSEIFGTSRGVPVSASAIEGLDAEGLDAQILEYWEQVAEFADDAPPPPPEGAGAVEAEFIRIAQDVAFGATSIDDGVAEFFTSASGIVGTR
ncbi:ABC transporter substrate-binding protein [Myceligenerans indicum]|uniref:Carbohydrate ABC transporter substrate-binding protein n=1 Tax=Myceligenerans indicum TaxID=2593663 RepID=A0ABS1LQU2_9MICO|nr:ABC transporter substrate-binding protein [Myceligenerans indicum]MBL0888671.1 carbohydrate ABC transporter substrate-binding protein [Myceligenerans indicum]